MLSDATILCKEVDEFFRVLLSENLADWDEVRYLPRRALRRGIVA